MEPQTVNQPAAQIKSKPKPEKDVWANAPENIKTLAASGVPVHEAQFQGSVNNGNKTPEVTFSMASSSHERRVDMKWTPYGLICHHVGKYFTVPLPMVKFAYFK